MKATNHHTNSQIMKKLFLKNHLKKYMLRTCTWKILALIVPLR